TTLHTSSYGTVYLLKARSNNSANCGNGSSGDRKEESVEWRAGPGQSTSSSTSELAFVPDAGRMNSALAPSASSERLVTMRSLFPGMDPYIEAADLWEDFHSELIAEIKRALLRLVPDRYVIRTGERSYIVLAPSDREMGERGFQPYVAVPGAVWQKPHARP